MGVLFLGVVVHNGYTAIAGPNWRRHGMVEHSCLSICTHFQRCRFGLLSSIGSSTSRRSLVLQDVRNVGRLAQVAIRLPLGCAGVWIGVPYQALQDSTRLCFRGVLKRQDANSFPRVPQHCLVPLHLRHLTRNSLLQLPVLLALLGELGRVGRQLRSEVVLEGLAPTWSEGQAGGNA